MTTATTQQATAKATHDMCSGVQPALFGSLTAAPASISARTTSGVEATCSAVEPYCRSEREMNNKEGKNQQNPRTVSFHAIASAGGLVSRMASTRSTEPKSAVFF